MYIESQRQERFTAPLTLISSSSNQVAVFAQSPLILKYSQQNPNDIQSQAIKGLISYGQKINCQQQAKQMANSLQQALSTKDRKTIGDMVIHLYTRESFLYKHINRQLRNAQFQNEGSTKVISDSYHKIYDLLPFCYILNQHLVQRTRDEFKGTVYRGCNLNQQQIDQYIQNVGQHRQWNGFTSTTKNRKKAEQFGNTLFIIKLGEHEQSWGLHYGLQIQKYSAFPGQQEVLLFAGMQIMVQKVAKAANRYLVTIICTDLGG